MFPRRCNILFTVSKFTIVFFLFLYSRYHIYTLKFIYNNKEWNAIGLTFFTRYAKKRIYESLIPEKDVEDKFLNLCIYHMWIILYRPYFLNGLICSLLSNSENRNKIHSISKCVQNIFLSISKRFLTLLTFLTPSSIHQKYKRWIRRSTMITSTMHTHTFLSTNNS